MKVLSFSIAILFGIGYLFSLYQIDQANGQVSEDISKTINQVLNPIGNEQVNDTKTIKENVNESMKAISNLSAQNQANQSKQLVGIQGLNLQPLTKGVNISDFTTNFGNVSKAIEEKYQRNITFLGNKEQVTYARVVYESPSTILLQGDLILQVPVENADEKSELFNSQLWQAMDMVKEKYGYHLQQVLTSGQGSVGNPTTVYLLMVE